MCSETQMIKLPLIHFSEENLKPGTSSWSSTCEKVRDALEEHTCFLIHYPKIKTELRNAIFLALEELFDLPTETKLKKNSSPDNLIGYIGQLPFNPTYEGMAIEDATSPEAISKFTNLMWPSGNDRFCEIVESYKKQLSDLEKMVMRMVFECFGLEKFYGHYYESYDTILAFNKHRPPELNEKLGGVEEHTDPTFITLLEQNEVSSLEVKSKDGSWIAVEFPPSSFLAMAGDALLAWSNSRVHSTLHRVRLSPRETRFSIALFSHHNGIIQVPEELVDEEHPLKFKPFDHLGLFHFSFMNPSMLDERKISAYCGI